MLPLPPRLLRLASDERLVAAARNGSAPAFEAIYDRHHRGILSFCRHMLGSHEEAEDAVQHTFLAAHRHLCGSDREIQLRPWLFAIARNRCVSMLRARRERPSDEIDEPTTDGLTAEVQRRAELRELLADLADLPEQQRAALVLSELGDLTHEEIAGIVGCPREKVKALVFQARTALQQSRQARETPCSEIREMVATLTGGALRRGVLRRHLRGCPGCREFEAEVRRQRRAMAAVLPVIPTLGLKESALAAALGTKAAAAGAGAVGVTAAKVLAVAAVASGGSVAGYQALAGDGPPARGAAGAPGKAAPGGPGAAAPAAAGEDRGGPATPVAADRDPGARKRAKSRRGRRGAADRGSRGRELAKSRGKGRKHGLHGTQPRGRPAEPGARGRSRAAERRPPAATLPKPGGAGGTGGASPAPRPSPGGARAPSGGPGGGSAPSGRPESAPGSGSGSAQGGGGPGHGQGRSGQGESSTQPPSSP